MCSTAYVVSPWPTLDACKYQGLRVLGSGWWPMFPSCISLRFVGSRLFSFPQRRISSAVGDRCSSMRQHSMRKRRGEASTDRAASLKEEEMRQFIRMGREARTGWSSRFLPFGRSLQAPGSEHQREELPPAGLLRLQASTVSASYRCPGISPLGPPLPSH